MGCADELLTKFGSLGAVLAAAPRSLGRAADGLGPAAQGIFRFNAATTHVLQSRIAERPLMSCLPAVIDYLRFGLSFIALERIRILYLDARNRLIRDEQVAEGTSTRVMLEIEAILERATELGSTSLILVHNHPSGDPMPSRQDIDLTLRIAAVARHQDIMLIDHLIVGAERIYSFHHAGIIA